MTGLMAWPAGAANAVRGNAAAAVMRAAFCNHARRVRVNGRDSHGGFRHRSVEFTFSTRIRRFYEASTASGRSTGGYELIENGAIRGLRGKAMTTRGLSGREAPTQHYRESVLHPQARRSL